MCWCWLEVPNKRPLFSTLEKLIEKLLPPAEAERFVQLNESYAQLNMRTGVSNDYVLPLPDYMNQNEIELNELDKDRSKGGLPNIPEDVDTIQRTNPLFSNLIESMVDNTSYA